jgi:hypothetical protein
VTKRTLSAGPTAWVRFTQSMRLTTDRWLTTTPLGAPVEPEVKMV